jgi:hypothetical protein
VEQPGGVDHCRLLLKLMGTAIGVGDLDLDQPRLWFVGDPSRDGSSQKQHVRILAGTSG